MNPAIPTVWLLGVPLASLRPKDALAEVERLVEADAPGMVAHANVHTLNRAAVDSSYRDVLRRADLVLNDGKGVLLAARMNRERFPADLNGNFFTPRVLHRAADAGWTVYFLGAGPGVAERAAERLCADIPKLQVTGARDGYFDFENEDEIVEGIRATGADLLLVGLGNPRQERWLDRRLASTGARLGIGVGAFFDFQAGRVPRAPAWMNRAGIEWVHRLAQEPDRMWRRYVLGNPKFLMRVARERWGLARARSA